MTNMAVHTVFVTCDMRIWATSARNTYCFLRATTHCASVKEALQCGFIHT